ncbi:MAG: 3-dehydroquinate synthase [Streptococcaceae bacterium]|jgi:3-dehydroquinate synthase|nr:3-dehydroquinate synthase [Streptococcaceae bacterium]
MKINVDIPHHPYDIVIERGALKTVGAWAAGIWQPQKLVLITDSNVSALYGAQVAENLRDAGFEVVLFEFPAGEASKVLATAEKAWDFCAEVGLTRSDGIVGLGGGVTGDLAGFVASTYMRGIHFLQIATSLTAQVDSSVGGKTGVNSKLAKNMIGTFTQPDGVLIDPDILETLGKRELIEGMGEVVKCGLIGDVTLWEKLSEMPGDSILSNADFLIEHAVEVKRKVVVEDEHDNGKRLYLNFGHTIGHAVEATAGYGKVMHGEAVAIGMVQISKIAEGRGLMPAGISDQIREMCIKFGLPVDYEPWDVDVLYTALTHDKKARGSQIKTVLVPEIGTARIHQVPLDEMREWLVK